MRSYDPEDKYDKEEVDRLNPEGWQLDLLKLNPEYPHWGPHEDYMWKDGSGWDSRVIAENWKAFGPWSLDDMNECVNFYFSVNRKSEKCPVCNGEAYHPKSHHISNGFYKHMNQEGEEWCDKITQDETEALLSHGRLHDLTRDGHIPNADEVNAWERGRRGIGHDCINRSILIEARLKRLGLPQWCENCTGHGTVYVEDKCHVSLTLWMLHPRKGCSRGVEVTKLEESELPAVFAWLNEAAVRNSQRFSKLPSPALSNN